LLALSADRPGEGRDMGRRIEVLWPDTSDRKPLTLLGMHYFVVLYEERGIGAGALRILLERGPEVERTLRWYRVIERGQYLNYSAGAHVAAAAAAVGQRREELLRAAERAISRMKRPTLTNPSNAYLPSLLAASIAATRGDRDRAVALLLEAEARC